eukprot:m.41401 g.41401  ORF g.41401 m.41401 type:complete len:95 (+) comp10550_c2_seq1:1561-1845(+)
MSSHKHTHVLSLAHSLTLLHLPTVWAVGRYIVFLLTWLCAYASPTACFCFDMLDDWNDLGVEMLGLVWLYCAMLCVYVRTPCFLTLALLPTFSC